MDANEFVSKLKADGTENDFCDLDIGIKEYRGILSKLPQKDRGPFSLNVLCIICRNLDKVSSWSLKVNKDDLLTLSIYCVDETKLLSRSDQVKTLACIYHVHRFVVRQPSKISPDLIIKLSNQPFDFEPKNLLKEYCKTYWNILADRIAYIEKLKSIKININKLHSKLIEDITKIILIYDAIQFCNNLLVFLIKKLFFLYNGCDYENIALGFKKIFESLSKVDNKSFKKLKDSDVKDLYVKFNECVYVLTDHASRAGFKTSILQYAVKTMCHLIGHNQEIFHCVQSFYLNGFGSILCEGNVIEILDAKLNAIVNSCQVTEKLGYANTLEITYPYLNQMLRLFIEYLMKNSTELNVPTEVCESLLKLILFFMKKLNKCQQILKCDDCSVKSGRHDSLRVSFHSKSIFNISLNKNELTDDLSDLFYHISMEQHSILDELKTLGCKNHEKCFKKIQTDIHNIAILLNKAENFNSSIKLFNLYLLKEIVAQKTESDMKNISRAFYNKSICELDFKLYENSLKSAYLSFIFAQPDALKSEKHISLVIDIKAKLAKAGLEFATEKNALAQDGCTEKANGVSEKANGVSDKANGGAEKANGVSDKANGVSDKKNGGAEKANGGAEKANGGAEKQDGRDNSEEMSDDDRKQMVTVLDVAKEMGESCEFGDLKKYFSKIKFSILLKHEFTMYAQLWPSVVPIAGIWTALLNLANDEQPPWIIGEDKDELLWTLCEVIMETVNVVRTIHNDQFMKIIYILVERFKNNKNLTPKLNLIYATLGLIKTEYELTKASKKYLWKIKNPSIDPDQAELNRTLAQEHESLKSSLDSIELLTKLLPDLNETSILKSEKCFKDMLKILDVFVPLLLFYSNTAHGLQLAFICCEISGILDEGDSYVKNASAILSYATRDNGKLKEIIDKASSYVTELLKSKDSLETALVFLCESAIVAAKCMCYGDCAQLLSFVQSHLTEAMESDPKLNLDLALGRLLDAQTQLCDVIDNTNVLSCVLAAQRHYLTAYNSETKWTSRQYKSLQIKLYISLSSLKTVYLCRCLLLWRRARSGAGVALPTATAIFQARIYANITCVHKVDDSQIKIDHRLKHILGIQPWNQSQPYTITQEKKTHKQKDTAKGLETMLEVQKPKKQPTSPSILCNDVPVFKLPIFLTHTDCNCFSCQSPAAFVLTCQTVGLQAATYFRAKEFDVASDYFNGFIHCCEIVDRKLSTIDIDLKKRGFVDLLVDLSMKDLIDWFKTVQVDAMIQYAFFELSQSRFEKADSIIIRIHELIDEFTIDSYLKNEVHYLLSVSAYLRRKGQQKPIKIPDLEDALENLKLSPQKTELLKTPESKITKLSKIPKKPVDTKLVPDEEIPNTRRRVIKLNLDDNSDEKPESSKKRPLRKPSKVPVPKTSKPVVEIITPRPKNQLKVYSKKDKL